MEALVLRDDPAALDLLETVAPGSLDPSVRPAFDALMAALKAYDFPRAAGPLAALGRAVAPETPP